MPSITDAFSNVAYLEGISASLDVSCSFFKEGATDRHPINWRGTWGGFLRGVYRTFPSDWGLDGNDPKLNLPAVCGATFRPGEPRSRSGVDRVGLILANFDNTIAQETGEVYLEGPGTPTNRPVMAKIPIKQPVLAAQVAKLLKERGVTGVAWSTWSSTEECPRFRVAIPLAVPVPGDLWLSAVEVIIQALGWEELVPALDLALLRNPAALGMMPGAPRFSAIGRIFVDGDPLMIPRRGLDPNAKEAVHLSPWQVELLRSRSRTPDPRWWQAYLSAGFLEAFPDLDLTPILRGLGCWVGDPKPHRHGVIYPCTCPWSAEHLGGLDDDCAAVFALPGRWPGWRCSYVGHSHLGLRDILEAAWGRP